MDPLIKLNFVIQGYVPNASDRILQGTISLNDLMYIANYLIMCLLFIEFFQFLYFDYINYWKFCLDCSYGLRLIFNMNSLLPKCHAFHELICSLRKVKGDCISAPSLISFNNWYCGSKYCCCSRLISGILDSLELYYLFATPDICFRLGFNGHKREFQRFILIIMVYSI